MGWLIERRIKSLLDKHVKHEEMISKAALARSKMDSKDPGAVKLSEEVVKLAKKLKYDKALIREVEVKIRNYKLDTPKNLW